MRILKILILSIISISAFGQQPFYGSSFRWQALTSDPSIVNGLSWYRTDQGKLYFRLGASTEQFVFKSYADANLAGYTFTNSPSSGYIPTFNGVNITWQATTGGDMTVGTTVINSGTSGRILYNNAGVLGEYPVGTGVATALSVNTGSAGAFVVNGGALGTPSSGTLTNATGLPISTGVSGLGSGVATLLGTFSWTNFNSAITGTAPYWSLASGGTFTASPTLAMAGFDVNFLNGNALFGPTGATITASTKMDVRGNGTGSSDWSLRLANSANASRFQFTNDAKMEIGSAATKPYISSSDNTVSQSPTGNNLFFRGLGNFPFLFNASTLSGGSSKNIIRVDGGTITNTSGDSYSSVVDILSLVGSGAGTATLRRFYAAGSTTLTTGSHNYSAFVHGTTVTSSSGTPTAISFNSIPEYNLTGTSAGTLIGFRHSPTRTSINGAPEYAFIADGGLSGFGTLTPTARIQSIGTGNTTAINLLLESNDGTDRWAWQDNGVLLLAGSAGTSGQVLTSQGAGAAPIWSTITSGWAVTGTTNLTGNVTINANAGSGTTNTLTIEDKATGPNNIITVNASDNGGLGYLQFDGGSDGQIKIGSTETFIEATTLKIKPGGSTGTTGQVLTSGGSGGSVTWETISGASAASESTAGIAEIATQAETDTGTDDGRIVSPLKMKTSINYSANHIYDTDRKLFQFDDFTSNLSVAPPDWSSNAGTGAISKSTFGQNTTEHAQGVTELSTSSSATARVVIGKPQYTFGNGHTTIFRERVAISNISDGTETYSLRIGYVNAATSADASELSNGIFFRYTHSVNSGKWECVTRSSSTETATDSGVTAAAGAFDIFEIRVNSDATSVTFYINGSLVATNTTNIPSGTALSFVTKIEKSAGTTARLVYVDWFDCLTTVSSAR